MSEIQGENEPNKFPVVVSVNKDSEKFSNYFERYSTSLLSQINIENIAAFNKKGISLYETSPTIENPEIRHNHIIWFYNNPQKSIPVYEPIPYVNWQELSNNPELVERVNIELIKSFDKVLFFYPWKVNPKGFVIEGSNNFGLEAGNYLGIRVNFEEVKHLIDAIKKRDEQEVKKEKTHLEASMIHELTHLERDDGLVSTVQTEIASHIAQFIYDPNNEVFNLQIEHSLESIKNPSEKRSQSDSLYDKAIYYSLLIITEELAGHSQTIKQTLGADEDSRKIKTLMQLKDILTEEDKIFLRKNILPKVMKTNCETLLKMAQEIEQKNER